MAHINPTCQKCHIIILFGRQKKKKKREQNDAICFTVSKLFCMLFTYLLDWTKKKKYLALFSEKPPFAWEGINNKAPTLCFTDF